ncbi:MAG: gamma-glutamylcyclotransferase [Rhodospirillaceae bacterium]|nr:gamma-glutamylcyclotransferase [Rhodospirillaceae bacterium]|tara:strand:+ start:2812 stop:3495 length:684 start_codon:yes stop_codon:yes gene_type:complete
MTNKLNRDSIRNGEVYRMLKQQQHVTNIRPLTDAERATALDAFFADSPTHDMWVFGYGSLIWNPAIHYSEKRTARIWGYHRSFCLQTPLGRGTPERPGLVLALDRGGSCNGIVFKLPEGRERDELSIVWDREMALDSYAAVWVSAMTPDGPVNAVTFVINRTAERYVGRLREDSVAEHLATAEGYLGSSAEYLENTVEHLRAAGIHDRQMFRLQQLVRVRQAHGAND